MKKKIIVTKEQLHEYVERKKAQATFCSIIDRLHKNSRFLGEGISLDKANQTVIESYRKMGAITPRVQKLLEEYGVVDEKSRLNG